MSAASRPESEGSLGDMHSETVRHLTEMIALVEQRREIIGVAGGVVLNLNHAKRILAALARSSPAPYGEHLRCEDHPSLPMGHDDANCGGAGILSPATSAAEPNKRVPSASTVSTVIPTPREVDGASDASGGKAPALDSASAPVGEREGARCEGPMCGTCVLPAGHAGEHEPYFAGGQAIERDLDHVASYIHPSGDRSAIGRIRQAIRSLAALRAPSGEREGASDDELLREAINESADECTPDCDTYGHSPSCQTHSPAAWLIDQQAEIRRLRAEVAALRAEPRDSNATLPSNDFGVLEDLLAESDRLISKWITGQASTRFVSKRLVAMWSAAEPPRDEPEPVAALDAVAIGGSATGANAVLGALGHPVAWLLEVVNPKAHPPRYSIAYTTEAAAHSMAAHDPTHSRVVPLYRAERLTRDTDAGREVEHG